MRQGLIRHEHRSAAVRLQLSGETLHRGLGQQDGVGLPLLGQCGQGDGFCTGQQTQAGLLPGQWGQQRAQTHRHLLLGALQPVAGGHKGIVTTLKAQPQQVTRQHHPEQLLRLLAVNPGQELRNVCGTAGQRLNNHQ
ncbi:MAG: hypothetical protein HQM04_16815 [Magnetococcales bacterium]|nr:hypothetical protein [Magnetococcales bacterium]MBF0116692.1 hypothetical protein [Magnetococcales bacterium]